MNLTHYKNKVTELPLKDMPQSGVKNHSNITVVDISADAISKDGGQIEPFP